MPAKPTGRLIASQTVALLLGLAAAAPSSDVRTHPPLVPAHDVSVVYRLESPDKAHPGQQTSEMLHFYAEAGGRRLRLDTPGGEGYLLIDAKAGTATVVNPRLHAFLTMPLNPGVGAGPLLLDPNATFERAGQARIAGLACNAWTVGPGGTEGSVCVTNDGVILRRVEGSDPAQQSRLTAVSVTYAPVPASRFLPPNGFENLTPGRTPAPPAQVAPTEPAAPPLAAAPASGPTPPLAPAPPATQPTASPGGTPELSRMPLPPGPAAIPLPPAPTLPLPPSSSGAAQ